MEVIQPEDAFDRNLYNPRQANQFFSEVKIKEGFDGVVSFDETTRARPNKWVPDVVF